MIFQAVCLIGKGSFHTTQGLMPIPKDILDLLTRARTGFTNARDTPDILAALTPFGYDEIRLDEGLALVDTAEAEAERQQQEYAEQYVASNQLAEEVGALRAMYVRHVKLARVAFAPGSGGYVTLGLRGRRAETMPGLLAEARSFYRAIEGSADLQAAMAALTVDAAAVTAGLDQAGAVEAAQVAQQKEMGEAQRATRTRDDAAAELSGFWRDFMRVAEIALADQPQLREVLGLLERS